MFAILSFMLAAPAGTYLRMYVISKLLRSLLRPVYNEYPHVPMLPLAGTTADGKPVGE